VQFGVGRTFGPVLRSFGYKVCSFQYVATFDGQKPICVFGVFNCAQGCEGSKSTLTTRFVTRNNVGTARLSFDYLLCNFQHASTFDG
jgi:hypothetical protein